MDIEKQVCSLEQSKRLKELGVEQHNCLFYHCKLFSSGKELIIPTVLVDGDTDLVAAAFTVAELGAMWPFCSDCIKFVTTELGYMAEYFNIKTPIACVGETEAECRANLIIILIDKGVITVSEVNERLAS